MPDGGRVEELTSATVDLASATQSRADDIRVTIASGFDDLVRCMVIRGVVWLGEDEAKDRTDYASLFDPNDHSCTHLLVWVGDEPAGTMRLRWNHGFVRFERLAVRTRFRSFRLFRRLARFAFDLAAAKGFTHANALARLGTEKAWKLVGAEIVGPELEFHGERAFPMVATLTGRTCTALAAGLAAAGNMDFEEAIGLPDAKLMEIA
ncbi:GNAT family N-acetyltransferase [Azospirillum sp.]|uniref:GNAT family N-acetyltransferase n=1 Tax=Azospirillum sp. TaxID=34012 RepID=UPI003D73E924